MSAGGEAEDAVLVSDALAARPEAFARLVARHQSLVAALVARETRSRGETEDLVQDVFLEAFRSLRDLRDPSRFKAWLVQVALNRARLWGRRQRTERAALPRVARVERPSAESGRTRLERDESRTRLLAALRELPEETQAVVTLRYLEGKSAPEIAPLLGLTPEAVRMRLSRALADLRGKLAAEEAR